MSQRQVSAYGHRIVDTDGAPVHTSVATMAALVALATTDLAHGDEMMVEADQSFWYWHATSTLTADSILVAGSATAGRWLRKPGAVVLKLPFTYATTDGATLLTIPTGCVFALQRAFWDITVAMTGGSSAAIGLSDSINTAAGDTLGGSGGDVLATLTAGVKAGTIGTKMDALSEIHANLFTATGFVKFERIVDAFTAGSGFACLAGFLYKNSGA